MVDVPLLHRRHGRRDPRVGGQCDRLCGHPLGHARLRQIGEGAQGPQEVARGQDPDETSVGDDRR